VNLVRALQTESGHLNQGLVMQLNASDDRGIDVIRGQINAFVNAYSVFGAGVKFVVLDEVDYMTKNAQQAISYLINDHLANVRFVLICNYISKIDESLQSIFLKIHFNRLPQERVLAFLKKVLEAERVEVDPYKLLCLVELYGSDIRSMLNYLQGNQAHENGLQVVGPSVWKKLHTDIVEGENINVLANRFKRLTHEYSVDQPSLLNDFLFYVFTNEPPLSTETLHQLAGASQLCTQNVETVVRYVFVALLNGTAPITTPEDRLEKEKQRVKKARVKTCANSKRIGKRF
jgi:replication factor C subunit 3/5